MVVLVGRSPTLSSHPPLDDQVSFEDFLHVKKKRKKIGRGAETCTSFSAFRSKTLTVISQGQKVCHRVYTKSYSYNFGASTDPT